MMASTMGGGAIFAAGHVVDIEGHRYHVFHIAPVIVDDELGQDPDEKFSTWRDRQGALSPKVKVSIRDWIVDRPVSVGYDAQYMQRPMKVLPKRCHSSGQRRR